MCINQQENKKESTDIQPTQWEIGMKFEKQLKELINTYSIENESNTPDFILAQYILNCLMAFRIAVNNRDRHSFTPQNVITEKGDK